MNAQAVLIPVRSGGRARRSIRGRVGAFAAKVVLWLIALTAAVVLVSALISAVATGVRAGFAQVAQSVSAASEYLVIGGAVAAAAMVCFGLVKVVRSVLRATRLVPASEDAQWERPAVIARPPSTAASVANSRPAIPPIRQVTPSTWAPDPWNAGQLRWWNGVAWTAHVNRRVEPARGRWIADPWNERQVRWWSGTVWTEHVRPRVGPGNATGMGIASEHGRVVHDPAVPRIVMTTAEWQAHVGGWMAAGAAQQELWRRLSNAQISDADEYTLQAQQQMAQLSAEQSARQIQSMLDANPALLANLGVPGLLTQLLHGQAVAPNVEHNRRGDKFHELR